MDHLIITLFIFISFLFGVFISTGVTALIYAMVVTIGTILIMRKRHTKYDFGLVFGGTMGPWIGLVLAIFYMGLVNWTI